MIEPRETTPRPRLFGILCTYRRPADAVRYLDVLDAQTRPPDVVVVVDNASDPALAAAVKARSSARTRHHYLDPGSNVGPAGAFRLGFESLQNLAVPEDLIVHFDDDDPPVYEMQLERLASELIALRVIDPAVAGLGLSGGNLNCRPGRVMPSDATLPYSEVDHLHGGYLPVYSFESLSRVGSHDATFFYGFEELELGRRLHADGRRLLVDTAMMRELEDRYPKKGGQGPHTARDDSGWSRFHKERNLIRIFRRERLYTAIALTVVLRHVLKPLLQMPRHPRTAWRRLVVGARATVAGLRGSEGIDHRYRPALGTGSAGAVG